MKKLLLLFLLACHFQVFAQNGFFIQPSAGVGYTNATIYSSFLNGTYKPASNLRLLFGYKYRNIIFKAGFSYFNSGYVDTRTLPFMQPEYQLNAGYRYETYLALPVTIGYNIKINKRFSVAPYLGYTLGFEKNRTSVFATQKMSWPESGTNSFASMQMEVNYKLSPKFYLIAAPDVQYMIPTRYDNQASYFSNYTYTLNLGVKYFLSKHKNARLPETDVQNTANEKADPLK